MTETGAPSPEQERPSLPDPTDMTWEAFSDEYDRVERSVAAKEAKGHLDPAQSDYQPVTEEEQRILDEDWKAFSRARGFDEDDIKEYERWLSLSGQTQQLPNAINDPWRRKENYPGGWSAKLYIDLLKQRLDSGQDLLPEVWTSYDYLLAARRRAQVNSNLPGGLAA